MMRHLGAAVDVTDLEAGLAALGVSSVTKDAIQKILAPTAEYIGAGVLSGAKAGINLARVLINATRKHGLPLEGESIPPRVMKSVLDEAPFCEDELMAEYMGGVLASSWSGQRRDDRGVALLATIRRLSVYSLRTHYICYGLFDQLYRSARKYPFGSGQGLFVRWAEYSKSMDFSDEEDKWGALSHSVIALEREELAEMPFEGAAGYFKRILARGAGETALDKKGMKLLSKHGGLTFIPTVLGSELFLWAHGFSQYMYDDQVLAVDVDHRFNVDGIDLPKHPRIIKVSGTRRFR